MHAGSAVVSTCLQGTRWYTCECGRASCKHNMRPAWHACTLANDCNCAVATVQLTVGSVC
jgi:hypothetical protein